MENYLESFAEDLLGLLHLYCGDDMVSRCPALYLQGTVYIPS